jgi:hypothetical protein
MVFNGSVGLIRRFDFRPCQLSFLGLEGGPKFHSHRSVNTLGTLRRADRHVAAHELRGLAAHRALEFADGRTVWLTRLRQGWQAGVLLLPVQPKAPEKPASQ